MARQSIHSIGGYRSDRENRHELQNLIRQASQHYGYGVCSAGPYYFADLPANGYQFRIGASYEPPPAKRNVMRNIGTQLGIETWAVSMPNGFGPPFHATNMITNEERLFSLERWHNRIMLPIQQDMRPSRIGQWDTESRRDGSNPKPLGEDTFRLLDTVISGGCGDEWLDFSVRCIESDWMTKVDIDNVVYNLTTFQPMMCIETKTWKLNSREPMRSTITERLAELLNIPGGMIIKDRRVYPISYIVTGFNQPRVEGLTMNQMLDRLDQIFVQLQEIVCQPLVAKT